jgi:PAS domain S-box-containing protein
MSQSKKTKPTAPKTSRTLPEGAGHRAGLLSESEERFRLLVDGVIDYAIFMLDPEGRVASWNRGAERIKGYRAEEIIGQHFSRFYTAEDIEAGKPPRELIIASSEGRYEEEGWRVRKDGSWFWASVVITAMRDETGKLRGFAKVTRDLTERREAEASLRRHENLLATVLNTLPVGLLVTNRDGQVILCNRMAAQLWGEIQEGDDMMVRYHQSQAWWVDTRQRIDDASWPLWRAIRTGEAVLNTAVEIERGGERKFVIKSAVPLRDSRDEVVGAVVVDQDVTDRFQAERQLEDTKAHLAQAQKMEAVGRLAGGIAHDFNNLLTVINALSITGLRSLPATDPLRADLEEIHAAGDRAANLTRQLLAFSRRQVLQPEILDLNVIVLGVSRMLGRVIGEDIALRLDLAPDINPVQADKGQLEQVIMNLSLNARDAMPNGGKLEIGTATVNVGSASAELPGLTPGTYVRLVVGDTGIGMDSVTRSHIFEPFFTTKRQGEGTGLGLATVYGIIQQSGGAIQVDSEPGKGTSFRIYLPEAIQSTGADEPKAAPSALGGSELILLVEDEPSVRRLTANLLRDYGYAVLEVGRAEEALNVARAAPRRIDLVLTDVVMPGMSGPQLVAQLTAQGTATRALYMSGYSDVADRAGLSLADFSILQKPFTPEGLSRRVREALDAPERAPRSD